MIHGEGEQGGSRAAYNGCRNTLKLQLTCRIACRDSREASPEVSWELDPCDVTTKGSVVGCGHGVVVVVLR